MEKINLKEYLDVVDSLLYDFDYEYYLAIEEESGNGLELAVNELSSRFSVITNLGIVASGGSRGVFKLTDSLILKVNFEEGEPYESETVGEYGLWCLLQKNKELNELSNSICNSLMECCFNCSIGSIESTRKEGVSRLPSTFPLKQ